jgi:hypothetical protein
MYSKVVGAASVAEKTFGWSSSTMSCYVVSSLVYFPSLQVLPTLQGQIPFPSAKETLNAPLAAGSHPRCRAICTNLSRLRIVLLEMSINTVKEWHQWKTWSVQGLRFILPFGHDLQLSRKVMKIDRSIRMT